MVSNKRSKNTRLRGSHTHGYGGKKKHRGAGSRGGRGMAGTGKRADTNKPSISANTKYFGVHGFTPVNRKLVQTINLNTLQSRIEGLVAQKVAEKKGDTYVVDLTKTAYGKLLGSGSITIPVTVTVNTASARAIEKVQAAKGSVVVVDTVSDSTESEA